MFYAYIIQSTKTGRYYIGSTDNVEARLGRHNAGRNKSTKLGAPWKLVYSEEWPTKEDAYRREFQIKRYKGGEAFRKLIRRGGRVV